MLNDLKTYWELINEGLTPWCKFQLAMRIIWKTIRKPFYPSAYKHKWRIC